MHYGLIVLLCIIILVLLCFSVERYTSERSEWESDQADIQEEKTEWERIGVSEEEFNAIRSTWESGNETNASEINDSNVEYSNAQSEYETLLSQAGASTSNTEVEYDGATYTVTVNNSDLEKPLDELDTDWTTLSSNANNNYASFTDEYTENEDTGAWEPDDIVAADPSTSGITATQWLAEYTAEQAKVTGIAETESDVENARDRAFVSEGDYEERMSKLTVDDMLDGMKVVCASSNNAEWNESL